MVDPSLYFVIVRLLNFTISLPLSFVTLTSPSSAKKTEDDPVLILTEQEKYMPESLHR